MANNRTGTSLLPGYFRTFTNKRFMQATVDPLIKEPSLEQLYGYVGEQDSSPLFLPTDSYVSEADPYSQHYQFEPALVNRTSSNGTTTINNVSTYLDILNQISVDGGLTNNHSRLFSQDYYNYSGFIDYDKLVNYTQYYWVPQGPASVTITSNSVPLSETIEVTGNFSSSNQIVVGQDYYSFSDIVGKNPNLTFARGGSYALDVNQTGHKFYIQTLPGTSGISNVLGVYGNGQDNGKIVFNVPLSNAQDYFINMSALSDVNLYTNLPFNQINNVFASDLLSLNKLGDSVNINNKNIIIDNDDSSLWYYNSNYDSIGYDSGNYDQGNTVPVIQRKGIWNIIVDDLGIVRLTYVQEWLPETKVFITDGSSAGTWYYKTTANTIVKIPPITANLDTLYYQDSLNPDVYGTINIIDPTNLSNIDIVKQILGQKTYTSPNDIVFSNGLIVKFDNTATPSSYSGNSYIVEGVGTSIRLVLWENLVTPESFNNNMSVGYDSGSPYDTTPYNYTDNSPVQKDYLVINRSSTEGSTWARGNRWFHRDLLTYVDSINGSTGTWTSDYRAVRPIIEFNPDLALFNHGTRFISTVSAFDTYYNNSLIQVEGQDPTTLVTGTSFNTDGIELLNGLTVVFANDSDPTVARTIWSVQNVTPRGINNVSIDLTYNVPGYCNTINFEGNTANLVAGMTITAPGIPNNTKIISVTGTNVTLSQLTTAIIPSGTSIQLGYPLTQVHLIPKAVANIGDSIVIVSGLTQQGNSYYWTGTAWMASQSRNSVNSAPLFDLVDINNISLSDQTSYPGNNFLGNRLFGYQIGNGVIDSELGFSLTYQSIGNIGDIVFSNDFLNSYTYATGSSLIPTNKGFVYNTGKQKIENGWTTVSLSSQQYLERVFLVTSQINNFDLNAKFTNSVLENSIWVEVNGIPVNNFVLIPTDNSTIVQFNQPLNFGDRLYVKLLGLPKQGVNLYTVPKNLKSNPFNSEFSTIMLSQMRNHVSEVCANNPLFNGNNLGSCNLRDLNSSAVPGTILQHSAGIAFSAALSNNSQVNLVKSIDFNRLAYSQFKNNFMQALSNTQFLDINNPSQCLDQLLSISQVTIDESYLTTDMIGFGSKTGEVITNTYNVVSPLVNKFNLTSGRNYTAPSFNALYVYKNNKLLVKNIDYTISQSIVTIISGLVYGDDIKTVEYSSTQRCPIPATPTKLGLWPSFVPSIFVDNSYISPQTVVKGHDGSLTIAYGDYRDQILLEYETRIYNNIKVSQSIDIINPGAFRVTDYSIEEWTQLLSPSYMSWASNNNVDIFTNSTVSNSLMSLNYSSGIDRLFNENLPGGWRGIFNYFYDTIRPDSSPWEMLGFVAEPAWWQAAYGPGPYTSMNIPMWNDLEQGLVRDPNGVYVNNNYVRPGLTQIIPVDNQGNLLSPLECIISQYDSSTSGLDWKFGDQGPQEWAWRVSSEYPFAVQIAKALAQPAYYASMSFNTANYNFNSTIGQVVNSGSYDRAWKWQFNSSTASVPGSNIWIQDRIVALGIQNNSSLVNILKNSQVNLAYKMAGFTDKNYINVIADQSSPQSTNTGIMVPAENYYLSVTKSSPINSICYSAVVVNKTGNGFMVDGFNNLAPYFTTISSNTNGPSYNLTNGTLTSIIYEEGINQITTVPYGQTFSTFQQVSDFLISYGRWLQAQGFVFTNVDANTSMVQNWSLAVSEFLWWIQLGFDKSTVIALTPAGNNIKFDAGFGVIDDLSNGFNGTRVIDSNGNTLKGSDYRVDRDGTAFNLILADSTASIHLLDVNVVQYEHCLILDNITVFNDIIFDTSSGSKLSRILLQGSRTTPWNGSVDAPGFMVNIYGINDWLPWTDYYKGSIAIYKNKKYIAQSFLPGTLTFDANDWFNLVDNSLNNELIPNMAFNAAQFQDFYDVDTIDINVSADAAARNSTGFTPRQYLTDLGLNNVSQHKFYLGMIKEKGTESVINAFLRIKSPNFANNIAVNEQWAVKVSDYGAINSKMEIEFDVSDSTTNNNNYIFNLIDDVSQSVPGVNNVQASQLLNKTFNYRSNMFAGVPSNQIIDTTGNAKINDVSLLVYDINKINNLSASIPTLIESSLIWVASDSKSQWNMMRVSQVFSKTITQISPSTNALEMICITGQTSGLSIKDIVLLKGITIAGSPTVINGFFRVKSVSSDRFSIALASGQTIPSGVVTDGLLFKLKSVKYGSLPAFAQDTPARGWLNGDLVWCADSSGDHKIYENTNPWQQSGMLTPFSVQPTDLYGSTAVLNSGQQLFMVGAPGKNSVYLYDKDVNNNWQVVECITSNSTNIVGFGSSLAASENSWIVGSTNAVTVINNNSNTVTQILSNPGWTNFGSAVAISDNGKWLFVSSGPNLMSFKLLDAIPSQITYIANSGSLNNYVLPGYSLENPSLQPYQILVYVNSKILVPGVDYTLGTSTVVLTDNLTVNDSILITYGPYYSYCQTLNTGSTIKCLTCNSDGSRIFVGNSTANLVTVVNRSIQRFIVDNTTVMLDTTDTPVFPDVLVDGVSVPYTVSGSTFTLNVSIGDIVQIETNNLQQLTTLRANNPYVEDFGSCITTNDTGSIVYVGSPNTVNNAGQVFKFVDFALLRGYMSILLSSITGPLCINGFNVINGNSVIQTVNNINAASIPGIFASAINNFVTISGPPFTWTTNSLVLYSPTDVLVAPLAREANNFGTSISTNTDGSIIAIGAKNATENNSTTFDSKRTIFDSATVNFIDTKYNSGSVLIYEYQPSLNEIGASYGSMAFATVLTNNSIYSNDLFGSTVVLGNDYIFSIASQAVVNNQVVGALHIFSNPTSSKVWTLYRDVANDFDSSLVKKIILYNTINGEVLQEFPIVNPITGKFTTAITQSIDYMIPYDPAVYTNVVNSSTFNVNAATAWGRDNVGQIWWDTNSIKYYDNQINVIDSYNYWGKPYINSNVVVVQWIESTVLPSAFTKANLQNGLSALYTASDVYSTRSYTDKNNNIVQYYYFWVIGVSTINVGKLASAVQISKVITNLSNINSPYAAILSDRAFALYNSNDIIKPNTALSVTVNDNSYQNIHSEWSLFDDGTQLGIKQIIYDKILDSLAGFDSAGKNVPDPLLLPGETYGVNVIPRQTMFVNNKEAISLWVEVINNGLLEIPFALTQNLASLSTRQTPNLTSDLIVDNDIDLTYLDVAIYNIGTTVLVNNDSICNNWTYRSLTLNTVTNIKEWHIIESGTWDLSQVWSYADWYTTGYSSATIPDYIIDGTIDSIAKLDLRVGDIIKINDGKSIKTLVVNSNSYELVGQTNSTIQLSPLLYSDTGFATSSLDYSGYSIDYSYQIRQIFNNINNMLMISNNALYKLGIETLIKCSIRQCQDCDWIFKTSFLNIDYQMSSFDQTPAYSVISDTVVENFVNEVKPYHSIIKSFNGKNSGKELSTVGVSDYDLPSYYRPDLNNFKSPQVIDTIDITEMQNSLTYTPWYSSHTYQLDYINIISAGTGYSPTNTLVIIEGDGINATAAATVVNGLLVGIVVTNSGQNYTWVKVNIIGIGHGASAVGVLAKNNVRIFDTTIKFDRIQTENLISDWKPGVNYTVGQTVVFNVSAWRVISNHISGSSFDLTKFVQFIQKDWKPNTTFNVNDIVVYQGNPYIVNASFTSSTQFNITGMSVWGHAWFNNAMDRTWAYYAANPGMPGRVLSQIFSGIEFPGVTVATPTFEQDAGYGNDPYGIVKYDPNTTNPDGSPMTYGAATIDTIYQSTFNNLTLGTLPGDIITSGGSFVSQNNCSSPEELVNGISYDTLDIVVTRLKEKKTTSADWEIVNLVANGTIYSYAGHSPRCGIESIFVVVDQYGPILQKDLLIDYVNKTVTLSFAPTTGASVNIILMGAAGQNVVYDGTFISDGITTEYLIDDYTSATVQQAYVKINGSIAPQWNLNFRNNVPLISFTSPPPKGETINIHLYDIPLSTMAEVTVNNTSLTVSSLTPVWPADYTIQLSEPIIGNTPYSPNIIVKVNNKELVPNNQIYILSDGITTTYPILSSNISVTVGGTMLTNGVDYQISGSTIVLNTVPLSNTQIVISDSSNSEYTVSGDGTTVIIRDSINLYYGNTIEVTTFSNHNALDIRVQVYTNISSIAYSLDLGFDGTSYDSSLFDNEISQFTTSPYQLVFNREINNLSNINVIMDGKLLIPFIDYGVSGNLIFINPGLIITSSTVIVIRHFSENSGLAASKYRIFKDMVNNWKYSVVNQSTVLSKSLDITDEWIYVEDVTKLDLPDQKTLGIVSINGERITYSIVDTVNNALGNLRRSAFGTGISTYSSGTVVDNCGSSTLMSQFDSYEKTNIETYVFNNVGQSKIVPVGMDIRKGSLLVLT